jgi:predicted nucleotidyltransferase
MPRYFFTIHRQDRVEDDRDGAYLPDAEAALSYAEYTIPELRKKNRYTYNNDQTLMMFVKDEARHTVLSLPFFPSC